MVLHEGVDEYVAQGEVPYLDPNEFRQSVAQRFDERVVSMKSGLKDDHQVVTVIDQEGQPTVGSSHKKEIIAGTVVLAGLSVAGIFRAIHHLHVKHKN